MEQIKWKDFSEYFFGSFFGNFEINCIGNPSGHFIEKSSGNFIEKFFLNIFVFFLVLWFIRDFFKQFNNNISALLLGFYLHSLWNPFSIISLETHFYGFSRLRIFFLIWITYFWKCRPWCKLHANYIKSLIGNLFQEFLRLFVLQISSVFFPVIPMSFC